jgi:hypothetical protein
MKFLCCAFIAIILLFSCHRKALQLNVLSQSRMAAIMWDMIRADQYVSDFHIKDSSKKKKNESLNFYEQIFHIHQTTEQEFKRSLDYYTSRPDLFQPIIDSVAKRKNSTVPYYNRASSQPPGQHRINKDSLNKHVPTRHLVK